MSTDQEPLAARLARRLAGAAFPLAVLAAWEGLSRAELLAEDGFSRPTRFLVAGANALADGTLARQTMESLSAAVLGLAIAVVLGVAAGALLGLSRPMERAAQPTIDALRPVPSVALVPLALLVLGFSIGMSASVSAFACFWPVLLVTSASVRGVDPRLLEVARMLGFGHASRIFKFALPAAAPGIMVGVRVAAGIAIVVTITTEIVGNPRGLGYGMAIAAQSLQADLVWATLLWIGCVGWALNHGLAALERLCLRWTARR